MDAATDAAIARMLAEDQAGYYFDDFGVEGADSGCDSDYGAPSKKRGGKRGGGRAGAGVSPPDTDEDCGDDAFSASGRRKRSDTGKNRTASRAWTDEEERLFIEAITLHGRDWKACAGHIVTRDHRAVASHAQKYLIKALLRAEELPGRMGEGGRGYTLSGKPLDPNSASARAYGLRPESFKRVVETGFLQVGVHVTSLELDGEAGSNQQPKAATAPPPKRQRKTKSSDNGGDAALPSSLDVAAAGTSPADGPTEYVKNRPRRQVQARSTVGDTTESLDLTSPLNFAGAPGTGAPLSQPYSVTLAPEALLVMDFHAHLSRCEVIGLLGGAFNPEARHVTVSAAFPCRRAAGSDSSTGVELDAASQVEVTCEMDDRGLIPVGWYHSHPIFEARPSAKDNENQRNYQALCRDAATGLEPWVGAIVGPYHQELPSPASQLQLWVVRTHNGALTPYNLRAQRPPAVVVPGEDVENKIATALEQLQLDPGRVNLSEEWRPYLLLDQGQPMGAPINCYTKLRAALAVHLPRDKPMEVAAFMERVGGYIEQQWGVTLPPLPPPTAPLQPETAAREPPTADAAPQQEQQEQQEEVEAGGVKVEAAAAPLPPLTYESGSGAVPPAAAVPNGPSPNGLMSAGMKPEQLDHTTVLSALAAAAGGGSGSRQPGNGS